MLKTYYMDYRFVKRITPLWIAAIHIEPSHNNLSFLLFLRNDLPESSYRFQLLGLNLLCLLAQNRVAEFHTELELLPPKEIQVIAILLWELNLEKQNTIETSPIQLMCFFFSLSFSHLNIQANIHISHPVAMEQFLMEGSYNKIFLSKDDVPAASYTFFMDILLDTVRGEICSCAEKTYEQISVSSDSVIIKCIFLCNSLSSIWILTFSFHHRRRLKWHECCISTRWRQPKRTFWNGAGFRREAFMFSSQKNAKFSLNVRPFPQIRSPRRRSNTHAKWNKSSRRQFLFIFWKRQNKNMKKIYIDMMST